MGFWSKWFQKTEKRNKQLTALHRRAQRAESDAIHFMRLSQNLAMRLDYAVQKVRELRANSGAMKPEQESASVQHQTNK